MTLKQRKYCEEHENDLLKDFERENWIQRTYKTSNEEKYLFNIIENAQFNYDNYDEWSNAYYTDRYESEYFIYEDIYFFDK